jgi:Mg-chelatase subunit ChlD
VRRFRFVRALVFPVVLTALSFHARGQTCWVYTDGELAKVPITCVQKATLLPPCSWPTDCTTVPAAPGSQTIRVMHSLWHQCFGNTGGSSPPTGRSQRWYAFHRQFEFDFNIWRRSLLIDPIEQVDWCPDMELEIGTGPVDPPGPCGDGTPRPAGALCPECVSFPQCLFLPGGGPIKCPGAPSPLCQTPGGGISFPHTSLDQFANVDDVAKILDGYFHASMHQAVADADCPGCYNQDSAGNTCSPRDPMFWRLHHALDDVIRAWQDSKAVDVVVVVDRSGSMSDPDSSGSTKLEAALAALDNFADLLEDGRSDGVANRIGVVSYSDSATTNLGMTAVDANLRVALGPFDNAKTAIASAGPGGCTGIGPALQRAVELLCPPGDCRGFSAGGDNDRKAILLLTDGVENIAPCLQPAGASGSSCGSQCFGAAFELEKLEFTHLVAVGFGSSSNLNGPLLTLVAERQGGVYMQNPNSPGNDLKDFFAKAFADLSSEFLLLDPKGTLAAGAAASAPVEYNGCADSMLTFTSGWQKSIAPGDLKLLVTSPSGDLVRASDPGIEASRQPLWDFSRIRLPYRGAVSGTWRAQLVRPHSAYVNGFAPDVFADPDEGTALVRREIQRLCAEGCSNVVLFERGLRGSESSYRNAVKAEQGAGLLGTVTDVADETRLLNVLRAGRIDLVVYAQMDPTDRRYPYDDLLAAYLCQGGRAILSDARPGARAPLFKCAGASATQPVNWRQIVDGDLVIRPLKLVNPGYPIFTHAVDGANLEAFVDRPVGAVAARVKAGIEQNWFVDVLGSTLGKLSPFRRRTTWKTGEVPVASARVLPSYIRSGGWDHVNARVEVEYPRVGEGTLLAKAGLRDARRVKGELIDARSATLAGITIPTATAVFTLVDDGTGVDVHSRNGVWSGELSGLGKTDGVYKLHYIFDFTAKGCTTRRELTESMYVEVGVDPKSTKVTVEPRNPSSGLTVNRLSFTPVDRLDNPLGPGRVGPVSCRPADVCKVSGDLIDDGHGGYAIDVATAPNTGSIRLDAFGASFDVPISCPNCARLNAIAIDPGQVVNQQQAKGVVRLAGKAPSNKSGGAVVYLSSDLSRVASVPESVLVPAGKTEVTFPVTVYHVHEVPETVTIEAAYGGVRTRAKITISEPDTDPNAKRPVPTLKRQEHHHPD